jgi:hypothetical protein
MVMNYFLSQISINIFIRKKNIVDDLIQLRFDEADFFLLYWVDFYVRIPDRKRKSVGSKGCVLASEMTGF